MIFRFLGYLFSLGAVLFVGGAVVIAGAVWWYGRDLPEYDQLADYKPPELSRVLNDDGAVIARFAREARLIVPIEEVPQIVRNAFISAEDKNFYEHRGVDPVGIAKAMVRNAKAATQGQRLSGASTITQQVVKNLLLTNERSISRKIREAVLAVQLERELSKDRILELYLNQIYFGARAHGIGAAAQIYFGKKLQYLAPEEVAFLAALPKAPSALHPVRNRERATDRRNYVLREMVENGHLSEAQGAAAIDMPLDTKLDDPKEQGEAGYDWASAYMIEEVRGRLLKTFSDRALGEGATEEEATTQAEAKLYGGGLTIRTTLDAELQDYASAALRDGLFRYERSRGYRGPLGVLDPDGPWRVRLAEMDLPRDIGDWRYGVVILAEGDMALIGIDGEERATEMPLARMDWARLKNPDSGELGPKPKSVADVMSRGDVVVLGPEKTDDDETVWGLRQLPEVNGAVVAMEPSTGRVVALQGGFSAQDSDFNRVTQAKRQPGSSFKPVVYAAAFDSGYTPATIVLDAPVTVDQGNEEGLWRPDNYAERFYGPTPMRIGLEKSRNLITVRVAQDVGMPLIADYASRLGIYDDMPPLLSYALGAGETSMLRMVTAYATFVNDGKRVTPILLDELASDEGQLDIEVPWVWNPERPEPEQVIDPVTAYQTVSLMEGVVKRGTATKLTRLGFPVAGKTGTTNEARDAWFVGFTPDLVFGCFVGFDTPRSLGKKASGGAICGPVFEQFMRDAMRDRTPRDFQRPDGVELVKINRMSGRRVGDDVFGKDVIWEAFREGTAPTEYETFTSTEETVSFFPSPAEQQNARTTAPVAPAPAVRPQTAPYQPPVAAAPAPAPYDPNEPLIRIDPITGQIIVAQDPSISVEPSPNVIYAPSPSQTPQIRRPLPPQPPIPSAVGNSTQDLQDGRGLY